MPGLDRLQKRKEQYRKLYEKLGNIKSNDKYADEKNAVRESFNRLNEKISELTGTDENKNRKLNKEELDQITSLYEDTMKSLHALNSKMGKRYQELEKIDESEEDELTSSQKKEFKSLKTTMDTFDLITNTVSKDVGAFYVAANNKDGMSVHEIYESSRKYSGYKVKEGQQLSTDAGNSNVRTAITLIDKDGHEVDGYFTQDSKAEADEIAEQRKVFEENKKRFGSAAKGFDFDKTFEIYEDISAGNAEAYRSMIGGELLDYSYEKGLKELKGYLPKDSNHNLDKLLNTPEKFRVFTEMITGYAKVSNRMDISRSIGINTIGNTNRRNAAMSGMANLLGCSDVIAESQNVKLVIDGKPVNGTFMKTAKGIDIHKVDLDSKLIQLTSESIENLNVKKQAADLQVLDFICGNPDRHMGNLTYICEKDENGKMQLKGIQGIDNDSSFGRNDFKKVGLSSVQINDLNVITKSTAEKILSMNKETLVNMFYGYELDGMEIDNMAKRLEELQKKIKEDDKVYAQGYGKGTLIPNKIKIVDDSELDMLSISNDLSEGKSNIFKRLNTLTDIKQSVDMVMRHHVNDCKSAVRKLTSEGLTEFTGIMDDIASDDKIFQTGSPQYTAMRKSTKDVLEAMRAYTGPDMVRKDSKVTYNEKLARIQKDIDKAIEDCEKYKTYKHERNQRDGKPDIDPRPHKLSRSERRWNNVEKTLAFLKKQKEKFNKIEKSFEKYNDAMSRKDKIKEDGIKRSDKEYEENYPKRAKKNDMIRYDNYRKRSQYVIVEEAIKLKEAIQFKDPAAQAIHQLQYNIKLGYAMQALKPEDRQTLRNNVENLTGMKIELNDEQLFKRAVASKLVDEKIRLMSKQSKGSLNPTEKATLANLSAVEIKKNSNGYDDLMKNPAFEKFYETEKQRLDINSPRNEDFKEVENGRVVNSPFKAAMAAVGLVKEDTELPSYLGFKEAAKEFAKAVDPGKVAEVEAPKKKMVKNMGGLEA